MPHHVRRRGSGPGAEEGIKYELARIGRVLKDAPRKVLKFKRIEGILCERRPNQKFSTRQRMFAALQRSHAIAIQSFIANPEAAEPNIPRRKNDPITALSNLMTEMLMVTPSCAPSGANYLTNGRFFSRIQLPGNKFCNRLFPAVATSTGRRYMPKLSFTDVRVGALRARKTAYDVRDAKLRGFGVRVLPSGRKRFFVHCQHRGERVWRIVGDAGAMDVREARSAASAVLAAIRRGEPEPVALRPGETLFEDVAETVFDRRERIWKARTMSVNRAYLRNQILPHFTGHRIADIDRREVRSWFASLRSTPVAADRSMPVLSVIMREAELMGHRPEGSNPCRGIRRYRRKGRERFLSDDEIRRLSATLSAHAARHPLEVAAIRLLLLTGCRKGEILTLRWSDYRDGHLHLRDSKVGPRTVWLSRPSRKVLEGIEPTGRWVFPAPRTGGPRSSRWLEYVWQEVRAKADLRDVRLHDLRHTHASIALRQGETILAIGRLLGHRNPGTTLKYTHIADAMVREAAETVGAALEA